MKVTNIRELKHATATVLKWVEEGEIVEVTRRNKVVARIVPPEKTVPRKARRPDYAKRISDIFGDRMAPTTGTGLMDYDRGDR